MIENDKYYVDLINSSKANQFTAYYHYSQVGFKKAKVNLGVFRKSDDVLVGVLQWGCSCQENIKLNRYVKEPIDKSQYLELNRFSMADSEGKNSESQAISLGIKWIKQNMPEIKLLVSYAGRKEDNYGYIYQATSWTYLGYFISEGFWDIDGLEYHLTTLWYLYSRYGNKDLGFTQGICDMYSDVRKTWTKQFIYIKILDKHLHQASPTLPYPKATNEYPIKTREVIYKQNDEVYNHPKIRERELPNFKWEKEEFLFNRRTLIRRGELEKNVPHKLARYDIWGHLEETYDKIAEGVTKDYLEQGIRHSCAEETNYKDKYFRYYDDEPLEEIEVSSYCIIDEIPFINGAEAGRYLGVSRQAFHQARAKKSNMIKGKIIQWL